MTFHSSARCWPSVGYICLCEELIKIRLRAASCWKDTMGPQQPHFNVIHQQFSDMYHSTDSHPYFCDSKPLCDLGHRRNVSTVCMLYKIRSNPSHPLHTSVPGQYVPARNTRLASSLHSHTLQVKKCLTSQFQRCLLPCAVRLWNSLAGDTCVACSMHTFKSKANKNLRSI